MAVSEIFVLLPSVEVKKYKNVLALATVSNNYLTSVKRLKTIILNQSAAETVSILIELISNLRIFQINDG